MDRAVEDARPASRSGCRRAFGKKDGAPDIQFEGYQYFSFPMDHHEFTDSGVIGNPMRATAEKGEEAFRRYAEHVAKARPGAGRRRGDHQEPRVHRSGVTWPPI